MKNNARFMGALTAAVVMAISGSAFAGTITVSSTAPTVDGADIANFTGNTFVSPTDRNDVWSNRPTQGQTFLTGSNAQGYTLNAVTLQNLNTSATAGRSFNVVIGSITTDGDPEVLTQIGSTESGTAPAFGALNYITFTLATPLTLNANTQYGFLWGTSGSGFRGAADNSTNPYAGGVAIYSGSNGSPNLNNVLEAFDTGTSTVADRVFHVDLVAIPIPEPSSLSLMGLALGGLYFLRRRPA